ncbi:MAG: hypothetical protein DYG92_01045 [Leptolyngbya sp. PLA1]|nr:hypothetical protein [Leptolyngbya sp. PLA1]
MRAFASLAPLALLASAAFAQHTLDTGAPSLTLSQGLFIDSVSLSARRAINLDAVTAEVIAGRLADPGSPLPKAGDTLAPPPGVRNPPKGWAPAAADAEGAFDLPRGSYLLVTVESAAERVMVLSASGHAMLYENGAPRMGDPYATGQVQVPVLLRKGENRFLFASAGRGPVRASLSAPKAPLCMLEVDVTLPTPVRGEPDEYLMSARVMNASTTRQVCSIRYTDSAPGMGTIGSRFAVEPLSVRTVALPLNLAPQDDTTEIPVDLTLERVSEEGRSDADRRTFTLRTAGEGEVRRVTFTSGIDASVQYYAVVPPANKPKSPGVVLSLHGASVEASNQAASYAAKPDLVIVCPTNRRPFGFDWEDWGRADAMEVLAHASRAWRADPLRTYLTGHSMGGHGTWQLACQYPQRFAAIAPSAGWLSFETYGGSKSQVPSQPEHPLAAVLDRAAASSDTVALLPRLKGKGIYILHGDADDNVPVEQARTAREHLTALKIEHAWHEQPGAGHWWDDDKPGAACVDWPAIFQLFSASTLNAAPPKDLATDLLDENSLPKGSFKRAFANRFIFIYGTKGTPEQNRASFNKARFDAEQWAYRANGGAALVPDSVAVRDTQPRNRIIYGNQDTNAAWSFVDPASKVSVTSTAVTIADQSWTGPDLGALVVVPQTGGGLVGIIAGTGAEGQRTLDRMPYFTSGTGFPSALVVRSSVWMQGVEGIVHAAP